MLSITLDFVKRFLPDWPEWALDVLIIMTGLLIVTVILTSFYEIEETKQDKIFIKKKQTTTTTTNNKKSNDENKEIKMNKKEEEEETKKKNQQQHELLNQYHNFRFKYISVYSIIMLADWMQGTHMYTLYMSYNVNVSALFVTGFLSGGIFAPFLGSFVDQLGRKNSCLIYCVLEIIINIMEGYNNFIILLLGRIMGGISTNLLFSAFESWMTTEHRKYKFPESWLSRTYSQCSIINGTTAILAGVVAQFLEDYLGQIGPFHGAVALTTIAFIMISQWNENYGEQDIGEHNKSSIVQQFIEGWKTTIQNSNIWRIGLIQALSEGGMYTFVFMWVPTLLLLEPTGGLPTGCVFSSLMMAITMGGLIFPAFQGLMVFLLGSEPGSSELCACVIYLIAAATMAIPSILLSPDDGQLDYTILHGFHYIIASFMIMELCVGLFMPVAGTLRSKYVPDNLQGGILNIFRLPLNAIVVSGTYATNVLETNTVFQMICACFLIAALLQVTMIESGMRTTTAARTTTTEKTKAD